IMERNLSPDLGPEPGHQVDAAHRGPRLAQGRDRIDQVPPSLPRKRIELEVRVGRRTEREDPALRRAHAGTVPPLTRARLPTTPSAGPQATRPVTPPSA